jgi:micrococcal nuclease
MALLAAALAIPAMAAPKPTACAPGKAPTVQVAAALDGATLLLDDGRTITIAGIDPPLPPLASATGGSPVADAAKTGLASVASAAPVRIALVGDKPDRYGRFRANVFAADGKLLAEAAVAAGLARVHRLTGDPACILALLDIERGARIAGRGLWADPEYRIRSATEPSLLDQTGLYELVAGRVLSIGRGDVMIFINFGREYGQDFTVMVTPAVAKTLLAAGLDVDALAGKRVVVRGMIETSGGPAIRLGDPTDLEVLGDGDG